VKITKRQLRQIIREQIGRVAPGPDPSAGSNEQDFIENVITDVLFKNSGIDGESLVRLVLDSPYMYGVEREAVFEMLDDMQEDGIVFFDVPEDAWFIID